MPNKNTRENGWYWVKFSETHDWEVANYHYRPELTHYWMRGGYNVPFATHEFHEIGNRIPFPEEK